jgi:hypothetical protein
VIRRWLKTKVLSSDLKAALTDQLNVLEEVAGTPLGPQVARRGAISAATRPEPAPPVPGVYVYSYRSTWPTSSMHKPSAFC